MDMTTQMNHHHGHHMVQDTTTMNHINQGSTEMDHSGHHMNMNNMNNMDHMNHMNHMNMNGNMSMACGEGMMGMQMYFHTGTCEYVLFKEALVKNAGEMVGACVIIFILALFYEALKVFREHLLRKALTPTFERTLTVSSSKYAQSQDTMIIDPQSARSNGQHIISTSHFVQTGLHILQVFISYLLMLAFMTYNIWLCLAVVLGAGTGYFMFGWKRAVVVDVNEHCH